MTGAKFFARDLYPKDIPTVRRLLGYDAEEASASPWPEEHLRHVLVIRARYCDRKFLGVQLDLARWEEYLRPTIIKTAADVEKIGFVNLDDPEDRWLVPAGHYATFYGEAVALCYFDNLTRLREAQKRLRDVAFHREIVFYEDPPRGNFFENDPRKRLNPLLGVVRRKLRDKDYGVSNYIKLSEPEKPFSQALKYRHDPEKLLEPAKLLELEKLKDQTKFQTYKTNAESAAARARLRILASEKNWEVYDRTFSVPVTDPVFLEPESGLGWWDSARSTLRLAIATQSPQKDVENIKKYAAEADKMEIELTCCYPGGAFGGRDDSSFPILLGLAARLSAMPVRMAYDRYEQFLTGTKACGAVTQTKLFVDRDTGMLQGLELNGVYDGGGQSTLAMAAVGLGALQSNGIYNLPHAAVRIAGMKTAGAPAGSFRGFGIPQVTFGIESIVDEIAAERIREKKPVNGSVPKDVIDYRLRNSLVSCAEDASAQPSDVSGFVIPHHFANRKMLEAAASHKLWTDREQVRAKYTNADIKYGVGFACCMESFGTSSDAVLIEVAIDSEGQISVFSCAVDMGQGAATALSIGTKKWFGADARRVRMGESVRFKKLDFFQPTKEVPKPVGPIDEAKYTPKVANAMSASMFAFHHLHALDEACAVIADHGILPAAEILWKRPAGTLTWKDVEWEAADLVDTAKTEDPLSLAELMKTAHSRNLVTGAMVHTYFKVTFARATFPIDLPRFSPGPKWRWIDALLVTRGAEQELILRSGVEHPKDKHTRSLYASSGQVIAVEVSCRTGQVTVVGAVAILDAGDVHHHELLMGQVEGGFAMGVSHALLEEIPPAPAGSDGTWNLHKYPIASIKHLRRIPGGRPEVILLPLEKDTSILVGKEVPMVRKKGIAEAVVTPVPAAIHNAIADATGGIRLNQLPMRPEALLTALRDRATS